jgi:low temperature requirement protein LtrA
MFATLVMSSAAPEAFGREGMTFAVAYLAAQLTRSGFMLVALRGQPTRQLFAQSLVWLCVSAVPWIAGAVDAWSTREALWAIALALDYVSGSLGWPLPWVRRTRFEHLPVGSEHLSERYRQFLIVALGDMILVTAAAFSTGGLTTGRWLAFALSFVTTGLLWRIYIFRAGELMGRALAGARQPVRSGRAASYAHLVMVTGIVFSTVGNELVIAHPFERATAARVAVILGGPALFLVGRGLFEYTVFARVSRSRPAGLVGLAVLLPAALVLRTVFVAAAVDAILLGVAALNVMSWRLRPVEVRVPH